MRRISTALNVNPAAAVFGESQVGKSYLVQNLLKNSNGVLDVQTDLEGGTRNFILDLNPSGGGVESTSLITRFTERKQDTGDPSHPIAVRVFSPVDVALTLVDSYFSVSRSPKYPDKQQIEERIGELEQKYGQRPEVQTMMGEDQVYEMIDYITHGSFPIVEYFISMLRSTRYMERLACVIGSMRPSEWVEGFSLLWNDNAMVSDVFRRLLDLLDTLGYPEYVGINVAALLKVDGTILCVDRIKEFFGVVQNEKGEMIEQARVPDMEVWTGTRCITVPKERVHLHSGGGGAYRAQGPGRAQGVHEDPGRAGLSGCPLPHEL